MHDYGRISAKTYINSRHYRRKCACAMERTGRVVDRVNYIRIFDFLGDFSYYNNDRLDGFLLLGGVLW